MSEALTPIIRSAVRFTLRRWARDRQQIETAMAPFKARLAALDEHEAELLERYGIAEVERCCGCSAFLITGDPVCRTTEGEFLCEPCAPDWTDIVQSVEASVAAGGQPADETEALALRVAREHIAAGRGGQKAVAPLG